MEARLLSVSCVCMHMCVCVYMCMCVCACVCMCVCLQESQSGLLNISSGVPQEKVLGLFLFYYIANLHIS